MCGRYNLITDTQAFIDFFEVANSLELQPRYNIAPSQNVVAIRQRARTRQMVKLHWGLIPFWAKDKNIGNHMINARAETVADKPAFRAAFKKRRCLIPATGFYEWKKEHGRKQPYNIRIGEGKLFAFAGLWEFWEPENEAPVESCTIIVTQANEVIAPIHDRMPVILHPDHYAQWLDPNYQDKESLKQCLTPCPSHWLNAYPVSTHVNKPQNDDEACIEPLA